MKIFLTVVSLIAIVGFAIPSGDAYAVPAQPSGTCLVEGVVGGVSQTSVRIPILGSKTFAYTTYTYYKVRLNITKSIWSERVRWETSNSCADLSGITTVIYPMREYRKAAINPGDAVIASLTWSDDHYWSDEYVAGYFLYNATVTSQFGSDTRPIYPTRTTIRSFTYPSYR